MAKLNLQADETILWQGVPEAFKALDKSVTPALVKNMIVSLLGGAFIVAEYWLCSGRRSLSPAIFWIPAILVCVPIFFLITDVIKLRRTRYYVTDRRLAVVNRTVKDVELFRIREASLKGDRSNHMSLLCGKKALSGSDNSYRERTVVGLDALIGDDTECDSFAFYAVDHPDRLKAALTGLVPLV
ncbi:MAG: hypothetical protein IJV40_00430 [Oscillospiraceae bacterium]|nr:hypothetical protein [Oscillospiraceae bacterium]